jgi:hypothetical protein
MAMLKARLA